MSVFRSTDEILADMLDELRQNGSGRITDFTAGSAVRTLYEGIAAALSAQTLVADQITSDAMWSTAEGEALDAKAVDYNVVRKSATPATGTMTVTRPPSGPAILVPAGSVQFQVAPRVGQEPVVVTTAEDIVLAVDAPTVTVAMLTLTVGVTANLASGVRLLPLTPIAGLSSEQGFVTASTFTGGVDTENDDQFRERIRTAVQGRVLGRRESYLAATLAVDGVWSAMVLRAGETGPSGVIAADHVAVFFAAATDLTAQVVAACDAVRTIGQVVDVTRATAKQLDITATVYVPTGSDTAAIRENVKSTLGRVVNATGVGVTARMSTAIRAMHDVDGVLGIGLPLTKYVAHGGAGATDVTCDANMYAALDPANTSITTTEI